MVIGIMINLSTYSTILFMDSMVALEGKPLPTLPWSEIDPIGPILVMVVPQVNKEIDKRKRDGRLGRRAREFNRLIAPAAESAAPVRLSEGPPQVDIAIAATNRIDWDAFDDLDPEDPDARVVAQIINVRDVPPEKRLLFSHDINPIAMGARHGVKAKKMPDHWLLEPEPSPSEKEVSRLKARVGELEAKEPDLQFEVAFGVDQPLTLYQIAALTETEQSALVKRVRAANREIGQGASVGQGFVFRDPISYDHDYERKYKTYSEKTIPRYAARLHLRLETHYNQIPFSLRLQNLGHVQAENLVVSLSAQTGKLNRKFACFPIFGPIAPKPESNHLASLARRSWMPDIKDPVGRHEMEFALGPNRGPRIEVHCQDFRQGREWVLEGTVEIDSRARGPFKLSVEVTASNQRGSQAKVFELPFMTTAVPAAELFDLNKRGLNVPIPMEKAFDDAIERADTSFFEILDEQADEDGE